MASTAQKVDYSLLERFTDLLICSRCFKRKVHHPVRQLLSSHHRPLPLCHECAGTDTEMKRAPVVRIRDHFHF
jgi:hypothetical protein